MLPLQIVPASETSPAAMPVTDDDFGFPQPAWQGRLRGKGTCLPQHSIGSGLWDVRPQPEPTPRVHELETPSIDDALYAIEGIPSRRLKRPVVSDGGEVISAMNPSSRCARPEGIQRIDFAPKPQKAPWEQSKRTYEFSKRPTGYENPVQWEDIPVMGARPSHPVSAQGPVSLDCKKTFPENDRRTGVPPLDLCKPPAGAEWGGWGANGAPGRAVIQQPWDSLKGSTELAETRFSDARTKRFPQMKYGDTLHLTRWHLDPVTDIDHIVQKRIHMNQGISSTAVSAAGQRIAQPAAGKSSNLPVEGARLPWYEKVRESELNIPFSAR